MGYIQSLLTGAGTVEIVTSDMPETIEPGMVRLRMATASICGTDMHYFRHFANAGFQMLNPVSLGHEACAYVDDANGAPLEKGQLVAINPLMGCGVCERCKAGDINMCATKKFPGSATTVPHIDGFFRGYFDFPARCLRPVKERIDPDHLTFAEPLSCAMHSVNRAGVGEGMKVLVTGCGPMGLLATVAAHAKGAEIHVTDLKREAVDAACAVGATKGFVINQDDLSALTESYDVVIEASGSPHGYNSAIDCVRKQGVVAILSLIQPSPVPINLHLNTLKEISSIGSILFTETEFEDSVSLIEAGTVDFEAMIDGRFAIDRTQTACERMAGGEAVGKVLIKPN